MVDTARCGSPFIQERRPQRILHQATQRYCVFFSKKGRRVVALNPKLTRNTPNDLLHLVPCSASGPASPRLSPRSDLAVPHLSDPTTHCQPAHALGATKMLRRAVSATLATGRRGFSTSSGTVRRVPRTPRPHRPARRWSRPELQPRPRYDVAGSVQSFSALLDARCWRVPQLPTSSLPHLHRSPPCDRGARLAGRLQA